MWEGHEEVGWVSVCGESWWEECCVRCLCGALAVVSAGRRWVCGASLCGEEMQ